MQSLAIGSVNMLVTGLLVVLFVVISVMMMLIVLIQRPQGGGLSGAFGSDAAGAGQTAFGAKTGDALTTATIVIFVLFIAMASALNLIVQPASVNLATTPTAGSGGTDAGASPAGTTPAGTTPPPSQPVAAQPAPVPSNTAAPIGPVVTGPDGQPIKLEPIPFNPTLPPGSPGGPPLGWTPDSPLPVAPTTGGNTTGDQTAPPANPPAEPAPSPGS